MTAPTRAPAADRRSSTTWPSLRRPATGRVIWLVAGLLALLAPRGIARAAEGPPGPMFQRGDANQDGKLDLSDAVCTLHYLFVGGDGPCVRPGCMDALDASDNGNVEITDAINILGHLFLGAGPLPEPFGACGIDPTEDTLDCAAHAACGGADEWITWNVPEDIVFHSIWSEGYDTVFEQHEVHARFRWRPGIYTFDAEGDTPDLDLIEELRVGPTLEAATPLDTGGFHHDTEGFYPLVYRQTFEVRDATWTILIHYLPDEEDDDREEDIGCSLFDPCGTHELKPAMLRAERRSGETTRLVWFSCLCAADWALVPDGPWRLTVSDGTRVELWVERSYMFYGVAGETSNRRLVRAVVEREGRTVDTEAFADLVHAGLHHNGSQEHRVLFTEPIGDVYGLDVVECPAPVVGPTFCEMSLEKTRVHLLDAALERGAALELTEIVKE